MLRAADESQLSEPVSERSPVTTAAAPAASSIGKDDAAAPSTNATWQPKGHTGSPQAKARGGKGQKGPAPAEGAQPAPPDNEGGNTRRPPK